jgi:hypothetical protein
MSCGRCTGERAIRNGKERIAEMILNNACSRSEVNLESLHPFDTIMLQTNNSEYRLLLLDPKTGRALVEGGAYLVEPSEARVMGSAAPGSQFKDGTICVGRRLEIWADERVFLTSTVKSFRVKHNEPAESVQSISDALPLSGSYEFVQ